MNRIVINPSSTNMNYKKYLYACLYSSQSTLDSSAISRYKSKEPQAAENFLVNTVIIDDIPGFILNETFECSVTRDKDGSVSIDCEKLGIYSSGESQEEAIKNIKANIASLYEELNEDDAFSNDWLKKKQYLNNNLKRLDGKA